MFGIFKKKLSADFFLHLGVLLLALAIEIIMVAKSGNSNSYYAAAVKSMLQSFHNFFFVAYDPGAFITVDKPPVALWIQTLSAKIFGYHGWAMLLPQLIAQVWAVEIVYRLAKRVAGKWAGLAAGSLLALTPISAVLGGTNETDPILILFMLLSGWALFEAIDKSRLHYLLLSAVFIGIAFNVKMLQAYLILPAFGLTYFLAAKISWKKRLGHLTAATALLLAVSFSWILIVDAVPAANRPYVGSTQDNSELSLAIGYNGLQRIFGQTYGFMLGMSGNSQSNNTSNTSGTENQTATANNSKNSFGGSSRQTQSPPEGFGQMQNDQFGGNPPGGSPGNGGPGGGGNRGGGMGGGGNGSFGGQSGMFRLWGSSLGGQIGWYVAFALVGILAIFFKEKIRLPFTPLQTAGCFWGLWLLAGGAVFSMAQFMHPYYTATIAPPIAALSGIGLVLMANNFRENSWKKWLLPTALLAAAAGQWAILSNYSSYTTLKIGVAAALALAVLILIIANVINVFTKKIILAIVLPLSLTAMIAAPAIWIEYSLTHSVNSTIPSAGPDTSGGGMGGGPGGGRNSTFGGNGQPNSNFTPPTQNNTSENFPTNNFTPSSNPENSPAENNQNSGPSSGNGSMFGSDQTDSSLINYLLENQGSAKFIVATESSHTADALIINTGKPVIAWGGFSGNDPSITLDGMKTYIKNGLVRFFLLAYNNGGSNSEITQWVTNSCSKVSLSGQSQGTLYDCSLTSN